MNLHGINNQNLQTYNKHTYTDEQIQKKEQKEPTLEETFQNSAVEVSISMNAQIVLFGLEVSTKAKSETLTQTSLSEDNEEILNFLSGEEASNGLTLEDIGYTGKPILELTPDEAKELVSEDGFFGITQTSDRVANFVFSFAGDDLELLQKGRDGIVQGFEEAEKLFGGELPEISYKTQERTLQLIDEKIDSLSS